MVSHQGRKFAEDMGSRGDHGWMPGVSVCAKRGGRLVYVSDTSFGPADNFCTLWHLFDLIPEGTSDWQPKDRH
jgi:hypothetical protein